MPTGKTIALTTQTFVGKVMLLYTVSVCHNFSSKECLLILWLQSPSTVILESKKMKPDTVSTFHPSICHEVMGPDAMLFALLNIEF